MENLPNQEPVQQKSEIEHPYVSLKEARERVTNWLNAASEISLFKEHPDQIPRAIFVSHEDLDKLRSDYPNTKGIRIYFGLHAESLDITGLVVPVIEAEAGGHKDLVKMDGDDEKTFIYDFTSPCPIYCDKSSELYVKIDGPKL